MELDTQVSPIISDMTVELEETLQESHGSTITVFGFSRFAEEQAGNLGAEIGILTSASIVILGIILWRQFKSLRDTGIVILLTLLAIGATYGVAGILKLEFNGAMNSIPILLLAIGVDYGLHVVLRYREELVNLDSEERETMAEFSSEARAKAMKAGTVLTSAALVVAIFTDMVGFLSFRLSAQNFLVVFGTVIAVGLFFIYLLSVTALPSLLTILKPQKIALVKSVKIEESRFSKWSGEQALNPITVIIAALLISLPIGAGISQLEIGFDFRDQLDDEIPVVADFIILSDDFSGQNTAPLYVVINTEVFSDNGKTAYLNAMSVLDSDSSISEQTGVWELLELEATRDVELRNILDSLETDNPEWLQLQNWVDSNQDLTFRYLRGDFKQTVISFYAPSLDWQETVDFVTGLDSGLNEFEGDYKVSGRGLILAQISEDVAKSAVASTGIVATMILLMLIGINVSREETPQRGLLKGFVMWLPLAIVVIWVYGLMGWFGYQLNSQTVTIGALTLGLGVDYAVHFVTRMDEEIEHNPNAGIVNWISITNATTGRAMMAAALTTAGGFAVLNLSSLLPLRLFGQAFVVAILLALVSSIILLPCLMSIFGLLPKEKGITNS
jgi:predicted RND superfamily exporter protein